MRIALLATAAPDEGRGHASRLVTVAEALAGRATSVQVHLRAGSFTDGELERLRRSGAEFGPPPADAVTVVDLPDPNAYIGHAGPLVVFDDSERFAGHAAIVIQPSLPTWRGRPGVRADRVLAGYAYAPVAARYRRPSSSGRAGSARVVVCFGGSDPADVTARIAPAVAAATPSTTTIVGSGYRGRVDSERFDVRRDPPDLVDLLGSATVIVASAGTIKFELAVLGVPMVLVAVADDQLTVGRAFGNAGGAVFLGDGRSLDPDEVVLATQGLIGEDGTRDGLVRRAHALVDGAGADRIAEELIVLASRSS